MNDRVLSHRIEAYLRGAISAEDFAALEAQLRNDAAARREFRRATNLDSALRDWAGADHSLDSWLPAPTPAHRAPRGPWWLAAAAAIVLIASLGWINRSRPAPAAIAAVTVEETAQGCALFAQSAGAEWEGTRINARPGDTLDTGPFTLAKGLAQIEFFSGATVLVEGPAAFEIVSSWEVVWHHGKARVHVPPAARGFKLNTPEMRLVDLGTEFGVDVNRATQEVRVSVFSGEVEAHPSVGAQLNLREGEAVLQRGTLLERTPAAGPNEFASGSGLQALRQRHAQTRYSAWTAASADLARDARLIAYYPMQDVGSWSRTVRNAARSGNSLLDGGAVGAATSAGRWPEKHGLEFKRPGDRVRLQIEGTYDALTLACWAKVDALDRKYNALFLTDGYEPGEPHWQIYEDGRLMFSIKYGDLPVKTANQIYFSPVVFTGANTARWHHLAVTYDSQTGAVVHYMDGRELSREVSPAHVPGRPIVFGPCEIGNWGLSTQNHKFPVRNLNGTLDEFAAFHVALQPDEVHALYLAGKPD